MKTIHEYLPFLLGAYEIASRFIKSSKDYTIAGNVLRVLLFISNILNNRSNNIPNSFVFIPISFLLLSGCNVVKKFDCVSTKYVTVTYITKSGFVYNINIPYCDTIRLNNDNMPDSIVARKINSELSAKLLKDSLNVNQ
jgi:hypothetical protein